MTPAGSDVAKAVSLEHGLPELAGLSDYRAEQQPLWPDPHQLHEAMRYLSEVPGLVEVEEVDDLTARLATAQQGNAFIIQGGDCAESINAAPERAGQLAKLLVEIGLAVSDGAGVPTVKVGRFAGQYAKPRSSPEEEHDGVVLPSFRGEIVNGAEFSEQARRPNAERLVRAYEHSQASLAAVRYLAKGGLLDLENFDQWHTRFNNDTPAGIRSLELADSINQFLKYLRVCGFDTSRMPELHEADIFSSHEGLVLNYELPLTRRVEDGRLFNLSTHMPWIGERTRQIDGAHVQYFSSIANPVQSKIGPQASVGDVLALCDVLNPSRSPGRLSLIARMGADNIDRVLPPLLAAVRDAGHPVAWIIDPMHGNTESSQGVKTRIFDNIVREAVQFIRLCRAANVNPAGLHIELTPDDVTECLGGPGEIPVTDLKQNYTSLVDPRLNAVQGMGLAFAIADELRAS